MNRVKGFWVTEEFLGYLEVQDSQRSSGVMEGFMCYRGVYGCC